MKGLSDKQADNLLESSLNPEFFVETVIRPKEIYPYQRAVLRDIGNFDKVAWRSGHGVGKTTTSAWAALWFLNTKYQSKVITTASSWRQVSKQLWTEIHKWGRRADYEAIGRSYDDWEWLALMIKHKKYQEWFATGEASDDAEKMEGFHAPNIFFIFDESKAIPNNTWDALEGALTQKGSKQLAISTPPMDKVGAFYEIFSRKRQGYKLHHTSSIESPNVSREWIEARKRDWGEDSNLYKARVMGEFVESGQDILIPISKIYDATKRTLEAKGRKVLGVDVARYGEDKTVILYREGNKVTKVEKYVKEDTMQTAGRVVNAIQTFKPEVTQIDVIGVGAGVFDRLKELGHTVEPFNSSEKPENEEALERFANVRAEAYWGLRERIINDEIDIPDDEELVGELANLKYKFTSSGKLQIESKEDMKKRGVKSPDIADALMIAFYDLTVDDPILIIS